MSRRELVTCKICGKEEYKTPSDAKRHKTCSLKCRGEWSKLIYSKKIEKKCEVCGNSYFVKRSHEEKRFTCGEDCKYKRLEKHLKTVSGKGAESANWKGGRFISPTGYAFVYDPENEMANSRGYVREHRLVMSEKLRRPLTKDEVVHHKDGNKLNNDINNLELMTNSEHSRLHALETGFGYYKR